jgi:pSer/pThr/pTyr-binding forkhead associated (FHA) protein
VSRIYCPECGFANAETARYCTRCGAMIAAQDTAGETQAMTPEEIAEASGDALAEGLEAPALVVRSGGRAGESFHPTSAKTTIGRSPDCDVFLDDVTVSRKHAVLVRNDDGGFRIEDQGSLNGTFVNRKRVESAQLDDGDELQVGKYRLTYFAR